MLLTVSKRLEFSASRRLFAKDWSDAQNLAAFGPDYCFRLEKITARVRRTLAGARLTKSFH